MASDSLFGGDDGAGGSDPSGGGLLDEGDRALLDSLLADFSGGPAQDFDGGKLISGDGPGGEKQGALTPSTGEMEGTFSNGDLTMEVDVPADTGLTFSGKDGQTPTGADIYLDVQVTGNYFKDVDPGTPEAEQQDSIKSATKDLLSGFTGQKDLSVRLLDFLGKSGSNPASAVLATPDGVSADTFSFAEAPQAAGIANNEVFFDAGTSKGTQIFAVNLTQLGTSKTLVLKNVEGALLAGPGNARIEGNGATRINSDNQAQNIRGGGGNDTLVGGGNDTLTGGAGNDVFAFTSAVKGRFVITDFNKATDQLAFKLTGITNFAQLQAAVTKTTMGTNQVTFDLGPDMSVTLVGVTPLDITSGLVKFTF